VPAPSLTRIALLALLPAALRAQEKKLTYDENVLPILREKCFACHNPDKERGGLTLTSYGKIMEGGGSGAVIEPGDPDSSTLFLLASHKKEPHMPPKQDRLPQESLEIIRSWISGGALENAGSKPKPKAKAEIALSAAPTKRPDGPPPLPEGLAVETVTRTPRPNAITALASSPWAPLVAVGGQRQVVLYHAETFELLGILPFPEGVPHILRFSRSGELLLAGGGHGAKSGRVVVWKVKNGERAIEVGDELDSVLSADLSADQTLVALGGPSKVVRILSTADGSVLHEIKKHTDWIYAVEFSPDGVLLASADRSGGMFVWEAATGREFLTLRGHESAINDVSWRLDSNVLASAGEDTTVQLWEMENGTAIRRWGAHGGGVESVEFGMDGRLVTTGRDRVAKIWDQSGSMLKQLEPFDDIALRAVFALDGARVVAGDWRGEVRVWSIADGKRLGSLTSNPPTIAERLDVLRKEVEALGAEEAKLAAAARAADESATGMALDLVAARKSASENARTAAGARETASRAKDTADRSREDLVESLAELGRREQAAETAREEALNAMAAARKDGGGTELSGRAEKTEETFLQASAALRSARDAVGKLAGDVDGALSRWVASREEGERAGLLGSDAVKAVAALEKDLKPARDKAVADRAAHEAASAKLRAARAAVERLSAEGRIDQARKRIEGLLAESSRLEALATEERAAAEKLAAELAEVQKVAGASTQAAEKASGDLSGARARAEKASADVTAALSQLAKMEAESKGPLGQPSPEIAAARQKSAEAGAALRESVARWLGAQEEHDKARATSAEALERASGLTRRLLETRDRERTAKAAAESTAAALTRARAAFEELAGGKRDGEAAGGAPAAGPTGG